MPLDIGLGIVSAMLISEIFSIKISTGLILYGILFALLPDIDFLILSSKNAYQRRDSLTHYPLLYFPLGGIILWLGLGKIIALLFILASFLHFLHDGIGTSWGLKWLYPFDERWHKFLGRKFGQLKFLASWTPDELTRDVKLQRQDTWFRETYFRPSPILITEVIGLIIAIVSLVFWLRR